MSSARAKPASAPQSPAPGPGGAPRGASGGGPANEAWVCGHRTLPLYVQRIEGGAFRPEFVAWVSPSGVLAASPAPPDEIEKAVLGLLKHVLAHPLISKTRRPVSVRVNDGGLVSAIAEALGPEVRVRVGPTPEIDALVDQLVNRLDLEGPLPDADPWVDDGLDPDEVRGFFAAAADLYRAAPWQAVPDDATLFAVDAPSLGLAGACLSVVGGAGIDFGFLLFDSVADYETMRRRVTAAEEGEAPEGPGVALFSVNFEPGAEVPKATRAAVAERGWPLAGPEAYPRLSLVDADDAARPPTSEDLARAWALAEALGRLTREHHARLAEGAGPTLRATYALEGVPGRPEVTLTLPHPDDARARGRAEGAAKGAKKGAAARAAKKGASAGANKGAAANKGAGSNKGATANKGAAANKGAGSNKGAAANKGAGVKKGAAANKGAAAVDKGAAADKRAGAKEGATARPKKGAGARKAR
ncbi:MAG TPA: hypothetical protein VFS43_33125 [Polyangiaceae bacterium]|nr:hypothetical protein [Polyangiaceae bacterium]